MSASGARVVLALPADDAFHEITLDAATFPALAGTIRRIAFVPFAAGTGPAAIDHLRIEGAAVDPLPPTDPGEGGGVVGGVDDDGEASCSCRVPGSAPSSKSNAVWLLVLASALGRRREPFDRRRLRKSR